MWCKYFSVLWVLHANTLTSAFLANGPSCFLEKTQIGKCIPLSLCPQNQMLTKGSMTSRPSCQPGTACCMISAKIVTPNNVFPPAPAGGVGGGTSLATAPGANIPGVSVPPIQTISPTSFSGPLLPSTTTRPNYSPSGISPPIGSLPDGTPPVRPAPPNGNQPPTGSAPAGTPSPQGPPPPLSGNIVAKPDIPSKSLPAPPPTVDYLDTIAVSAEVINSATELSDKKCNSYHSMVRLSNIETSLEKSLPGTSPMVMIYGGVNSEEKEFPHMAALGYGELNSIKWLCGGSLISENFVVTAAHCLLSNSSGDVKYVRLGNQELDHDTARTQLVKVVGRISHGRYSSQTQYNDIALVELEKRVQISQYVLPICLFSSTNYEDKNIIATGWGKTQSGSPSQTLKKVGLELFTQAECQEAFKLVSKQQLPLGIQEATQLCAGSHSESKDTCQGDSGGPLQIRKNNRWYLIGITSVGIECGIQNMPGIYTRIAPFVQWIQQNVWGNK